MRFHVYNTNGTAKHEIVAMLRYAEDAAALVATLGEGYIIRDERDGRILWHEGREVESAVESYDAAAEIMHKRMVTK